MFHCFFALNSQLFACDVRGIDNRESNEGLPAIYNRVIEQSLADDCWIFFAHEDFDVRGDLSVIDKLNPGVIYGTFGVFMNGHVPVGAGCHKVSRKDGSDATMVGLEIAQPKEVNTLDCQSILVHSSLFRKYPTLRFDENLTFDLYAEDLCLNATENLGIKVMVFPLKFQHYSFGKVTERYHRGLDYLASKYPESAVPGSCSFIGGRSGSLSENFTYDIEANKG
jgi:hypothetical protein